MIVEACFPYDIDIDVEVNDKYKILTKMMYDPDRKDEEYCPLVNECIEEIKRNIPIKKFLKMPLLGIIDKETKEDMMWDDWVTC